MNQFRSIQCLLLCFEAVSRLKVNLSKSEMIPIGNVDIVQDLASILDCRVSALPITYLGLPLGTRYKKVFTPGMVFWGWKEGWRGASVWYSETVSLQGSLLQSLFFSGLIWGVLS